MNFNNSPYDATGVAILAELFKQAEDIYPTRAGSVEMALETPRAEDIHARLQAWNQPSTS